MFMGTIDEEEGLPTRMPDLSDATGLRKCFITGIGGFLGSHLAEFLLERGGTVSGTIHRGSSHVTHLKDKLTLLPCDILSQEQMENAIVAAQPQVVFHLAAHTAPALSWKDPEAAFHVNVFGTINLLEALRKARLDPIIVMAGSSAEYGFSTPDEIPIKEEKPLRPGSPYAVSKVAADLMADLYCRAYRMKIIRVRLFWIMGPRKVGDVCSDFARGIVAVERGEQKALRVGNLETVRDFVAEGDAVQGLWFVAEKGAPGEVYNLCSGIGRKVRAILEILLAMATTPILVEPDANRLHPADVPVIVGDNSKLRALGWSPQVPLEQALANILDYWRGKR